VDSSAEPGWPYPSYGDRRWLGGDRGPDAALAAVVRSVRTTIAESGRQASGEPGDLLAGMEQLAAIAERVDWALLSLVGEARAQRVSWSRIGQALGVSKQAAQQRFAGYVREALERARGAT